ncbi:hypothetical protein RSJ21_00410 (plasmid) [Clostridium botulinum]|uniref:CHC2 zinc finger domain-containing protein n=1 Tax=Clostridium botulinum TaxID=1491 RepID=UPI000C75C9B4|nr:CHC2 zinc finger domain-containing protein [Clostridium botulinum]AUN23797.1 hypothetical protein RSJ21_00410 [Clostridium botulinum]
MQIPIDKVQEAKEALGVKAAEIIANGLDIDKWNSRELKGCCPFHTEKTPSFIWDKKHNFFKCFGCGITYDIIDYYTSSMSFIDACRELFNQARINYKFDIYSSNKYMENKENKPYRYPRSEKQAEDKTPLEKYMSLRKISEKTLDYTGVKLTLNNWIAFEYYDQNNKLLTVKYRYCGKYDKKNPPMQNGKKISKTFCQAGKDTSPLLWGMNQINPTKPLLITEGETDRLAAIESRFKNTVSVPFGANNYTWIEYNWEWLEQFEKIYIWSDNDEAGDNMRKEVVPRLGEERCWIVKSQYKDINIHLYKEGKESVLKAITQAKRTPIPDTIYLFDAEDFDINKAEKIETPYKELNKWIYGWVLGTLNVITGINSSGKSTLINQMCIAHPLNLGYKTWVYSGELTASQLKSWVEFPLAGPQYIKEFDNGPDKPKGYAVYKDAKKKIKETYRESLFMYSNENDMTAKNILKRMEQLAKINGVKVFILDNLMMIDLECSERELNKKQKEFALALKNFAKRYNAVVHLIAHPRKIEEIRRLNKMEICGSGDITNLADYVLAIHRVTPKEKEEIIDKKGNVVSEGCPFDTIIDLFKNRPIGYQDKAIGLHFDYPSKRFYGDNDNLAIKYEWCKDLDIIEVTEEFKEKEVEVPW